jgi:hypothetical protein
VKKQVPPIIFFQTHYMAFNRHYNLFHSLK